jgi:hypothetical protein
VWFSGVNGFVPASPSEVENAFPSTWGDLDRLLVGMDVRPPGFTLRFSPQARAIVNPGDPGLLFTPPEIVNWYQPIPVDSVFVNWSPIPGHQGPGGTYFADYCGQFHMSIADIVTVSAEAVVNLAAVYASPTDTIQVWGTDIGLPDVLLRGEGTTGPMAVLPTTWGQVKYLLREPERR